MALVTAESSLSPIHLASEIKQAARDLGFDLCGITDASPPEHHDAYQRWLEDGCNGEMAYLDRQELKRGDINQVMAGVKTVVSVALNYGSNEPARSDMGSGAIARYARFDDYHHLIWERLQMLLDTIVRLAPEVHGKVYCDTGPISERDLAMRAGIGWIGKHTNLISRSLGNWFFLGELLLDCELPVDQPESQHCGSCSRCLPACPTGAITAPYRLDARRCISYLTIELKGSIPKELRPLIGNRIYGCDDCLAVCPWNRFAVDNKDPRLSPRKDLLGPELIDLLSLDDDQFRSKFRASPIRRTKRRGLLRNVCVALGNTGNSGAVAALIRALGDPEPLIQEHARWALDQIKARETKRTCNTTVLAA